MGRYILRKAISVVLVLFAISVITFLIFQVIPNSDPAVRMAGKNNTPAQVAQIRKTWHFDDSLPDICARSAPDTRCKAPRWSTKRT